MRRTQPQLLPLHTLPLLMLLLSGGSAAWAGTQQYQAPLDAVRWEASSQKLYCSLSHDIPLYGRATFAQEAGQKLGFTLRVKRQATRNQDKAHLRAMPPEWKHQVSVVDLDEVAVHKGDTPFRLGEALSRRMLAELQKGMFPTFTYRDWADARDRVSVALPGIHIKQALDEFITCLSQLPVYEYADYKDSLLHFAFGKHELDKRARQRLDDLVRYLKSDPEVQRIEIDGHTDNVGRKRSNDKLGNLRSQAVRDYLIGKGIAADKFRLNSFGERHPATTNRTDKGRAENRRALVKIVK